MAGSVEILGVGIGEEIRGRSESTLLGRISQSAALCTYGRADVSRELSRVSAFFAVGHCNDARRRCAWQCAWRHRSFPSDLSYRYRYDRIGL